eukprot:CAMPEP_0167743574 /NCGR_PEP_ID=MMETSP0110_2-20121227/2089_1 /TAXON_ID=629695 /ORGANISM="Gymnochlora sp., Strain CCMP2014" /LENGTH=698 /DNA_ID=CAMNT_0007627955 /DNA_START=1398 /DNA_END=3494 /DNA_ORIENTATION=+
MGAVCLGRGNVRKQAQNELDQKNIYRITKCLDDDHSGSIDRKEISDFFKSKPDAKLLTEIWKFIDQDADNSVSPKEFGEFFMILLLLIFESFHPKKGRNRKERDQSVDTISPEQVATVVMTMLHDYKFTKEFHQHLEKAIARNVKMYNGGNEKIELDVFQSYIILIVANNWDRKKKDKKEVFNIQELVFFVVDEAKTHEDAKLIKAKDARKFYVDLIKDLKIESTTSGKIMRILSAIGPKEWGEFTAALYDDLCSRSSSFSYPNVVVSPISAFCSVLILRVAIAGSAVRQLQTVLGHVDASRLEAVDEKKMLKMTGNDQIQFANAVYLSVPLSDAFRKQIEQKFGYYLSVKVESQTSIPEDKENKEDSKEQKGGSEGQETINSINEPYENLNEWISKATEGEIDKIFYAKIPVGQKVFVPMSVVHFKARLGALVRKYTEGEFMVREDKVSRCKFTTFMPQIVRYVKTKHIAGVDMPLRNKDLRAMFVMSRKPESLWEAPKLQDLLKKESLSELVKKMQSKKLKAEVVLPKIQLEWSGGIGKALQKLGVQKAFKRPKWNILGGVKFRLRTIIHKVVLELETKSEENAEEHLTTDYAQDTVQRFHVNRPFLMLIYYAAHEGKEKCLFVAAVNKLSQFGSAVKHAATIPQIPEKMGNFSATHLTFADDEDDVKQLDGDTSLPVGPAPDGDSNLDEFKDDQV